MSRIVRYLSSLLLLALLLGHAAQAQNIYGATALPTGASTSAIQTNGSQKTQIVDGSGNVIASTANALNVTCATCSGANAADEATFTAGASAFAPSGVFFQTTATNNALTNGQMGTLQATASRAAFVNLRNAAGTEIGTSSNPVAINNGQVSGTAVDVNSGTKSAGTQRMVIATDQPALTNPLLTTQTPATTGGLLQQSAIVPNNTTSVAVGTSAAHQLYSVFAYSIANAQPVWIKFYNTAQGSVTCGAGTPLARYLIPASGSTSGSGQVFADSNGIAYGTALTYCITAGIADADTTAPAASSYVVNFNYK